MDAALLHTVRTIDLHPAPPTDTHCLILNYWSGFMNICRSANSKLRGMRFPCKVAPDYTDLTRLEFF